MDAVLGARTSLGVLGASGSMFAVGKMCHMDGAWGAGDVGDVGRAARQTGLRTASSAHGELGGTHGSRGTPPSSRRCHSVYPLHPLPASVTRML